MKKLFVFTLALFLGACADEQIAPPPVTDQEENLTLINEEDPSDSVSLAADTVTVTDSDTVINTQFNDNIYDYWILKYRQPSGVWVRYVMHLYNEDGTDKARVLQIDTKIWRAISDYTYEFTWDGKQLTLSGDAPKAEWFETGLIHNGFGMISWTMYWGEQLLLFDRGSRNNTTEEDWEQIIAGYYAPLECEQVLHGKFEGSGSTQLTLHLDTYKQDEGVLDFYLAYSHTFEDGSSNGTAYKGTFTRGCEQDALIVDICQHGDSDLDCYEQLVLPVSYEKESHELGDITLTLPEGVFEALDPMTGTFHPIEGTFTLNRK